MKMTKKALYRLTACVLSSVVVGTTLMVGVGCAEKKKDSIVLMTEEMSGLFNPYYATSGSDMDVVGMTQIGMLSTDGDGNTVAGANEPCVVETYGIETTGTGTNERTVYTFVLKNGLKFSDGKPLTMNDVMFNIYEYLDPVYTGSSTMYSINIEGLSEYRTQTAQGGSNTSNNSNDELAMNYAKVRIDQLVLVYKSLVGDKKVASIGDESIRQAINSWTAFLPLYKSAILTKAEQAEVAAKGSQEELNFYRKKLMEDYDFARETFKKELHSDFKAAKESFDVTTAPYKDHKAIFDADTSGVFRFFLYEGYIRPTYAKLPNTNRDDLTKIENFGDYEDYTNMYTTEDAAVDRIFNDMMYTYNETRNGLDKVVSGWATAGTLRTKYTADALSVILHEKVGTKMAFPFIRGIDSLGHTQVGEEGTDPAEVTFVDKTTGETVTRRVAKEHNEDGTPKNTNEYDVLQITVKGTDPKAIYNFGFTVAPAHYYGSADGTGNDVEIDITNNKFGVKWADSEFQSKVIQSQRNVEVPMGAGAFKATDAANSDNPTGAGFWSSNIVYFKANQNFMFTVKAEKLRLQVVSASNAIDKLANNEVDYITPQLTQTNSARLKSMQKDGYMSTSSWQLGYGYIGINAGKIPNVNVRKAIMAAMNVAAACEYYDAGTCIPIDWPMSKVSWAYPKEDNGSEDSVLWASKTNGKDYLQWEGTDKAKEKIQKYMALAAQQGVDPTKETIRFTIAGASITEHPTYKVFQQASEILTELGWKIDVKADSQALTKLATGSLSVWAAAWGSTIDPDMYQVYHKNSTATSVYAWGYREIKNAPSSYTVEPGLINTLSEKIELARKTDDRAARMALYEEAMGYVLDLAVEMPVYQRKTLYAYNANTVKGFVDSGTNPYSSPLERIWELELVK